MAVQNVVIGVFAQRQSAVDAIKALRQAGLHNDQFGFVTRRHDSSRRGSVTRGIIGGILGGADMLVLPFAGPADAVTMLEGSLPAAEEAVDRLLSFGSRHEQQDEAERTEASSETKGMSGIEEEETGNEEEEESGAGSVAAGGLAGGLLGAAGAALLLPGIGAAVAGGALTIAIAGAMIGGITGGFLGALVHVGVPKDKARYYEQEFHAGRILLVVRPDTPEQEQLAHSILAQYGAHDIASHNFKK